MWNEQRLAPATATAIGAGCAQQKQSMPVATAPQSAVGESLMMLTDEIRSLQGAEIETLHKVLSMLEDQLIPVLDSPPPAAEGSGQDQACRPSTCPTCQMQSRIDAATVDVTTARLGVRAAIVRVDGLMNRLRI